MDERATLRYFTYIPRGSKVNSIIIDILRRMAFTFSYQTTTVEKQIHMTHLSNLIWKTLVLKNKMKKNQGFNEVEEAPGEEGLSRWCKEIRVQDAAKEQGKSLCLKFNTANVGITWSPKSTDVEQGKSGEEGEIDTGRTRCVNIICRLRLHSTAFM